MPSRRVKLSEIPIWGRFRRVGGFPEDPWCIRITEKDYCEGADETGAREAVARYPTRPGTLEVSRDTEAEDILLQATWARFYRFKRTDTQRADKKDFLIPV